MIVHPGVAVALRRLTMNELDVARAIATGDLTSPQQYQNLWLFAIRITGTGLAYRTSWGEYVWRDVSIYLNDDFLARCNGLPVIWEHPPKDILDSDEFEKRVVGSVFLPYIQGEDVWAIAKIHDDAAAEAMRTTQLSTSPAVVMKEGTRMMLESGKALLIEDHPTLLDHIAICENGVWDKKGPPTGVRSDDIEESNAVADRVAADSDDKLDQILKMVGGFSTRMDSVEQKLADRARADAEKEEKDRDERERADEDKRAADGEEDDMFHDRINSEAETMFNALVKEGKTTEEVARDSANRRRSDKQKWRADWKKSAADKAAADKAAADEEDDDDEKKKKAADAAAADKAAADKAAADKAASDQVTADAARRADSDRALEDRILARVNKPEPTEERGAKADAQALADPVYRELAIDGGAPPPMTGETSLAYRRRLLKGVQKHSNDWKDEELGAVPASTLSIAERRIYADASAAARNPTDLPDGDLRQIVHINPITGQRTFEFRGKRTFIHSMRRPAARVTSMKTSMSEQVR